MRAASSGSFELARCQISDTRLPTPSYDKPIWLALWTNVFGVEVVVLEKYVIGYGLLLTSINSNHYQKGKAVVG